MDLLELKARLRLITIELENSLRVNPYNVSDCIKCTVEESARQLQAIVNSLELEDIRLEYNKHDHL